jgi:hypothetical protein
MPQNRLSLSDKGAGLLSVSNRTPFASIQQVLEIKSLHGEYGMSGGAVLSSEGKMLGLLSHQRLEETASAPSQFGDGSGVIIAIPADSVKSWSQGILDGKQPSLTRNPLSQIHPTDDTLDSVLSSGLLLQSHPVKPTNSSHLGGGDGAGIGGGTGSETTVTVDLTMQDMTRMSTLLENPDFRWLHPLLPALRKQGRISIDQVVTFHPESGQMDVHHPRDLADFLRIASAQNSVLLFHAHAQQNVAPMDATVLQVTQNLQLSQDLAQVVMGQTLSALWRLHQEYPELQLPQTIAQNLSESTALNQLAVDDFEAAIAVKSALLQMAAAPSRL